MGRFDNLVVNKGQHLELLPMRMHMMVTILMLVVNIMKLLSARHSAALGAMGRYAALVVRSGIYRLSISIRTYRLAALRSQQDNNTSDNIKGEKQ